MDSATLGDDAGINARVDAAPVPVPACPAAIPSAGQRCDPSLDLPCEYGSDPHCRARAVCQSQLDNAYAWQVTQPDPSCAGNPPACPSSFAAVSNGSACALSASCTYPEGRCTCTGCFIADAGTQGTEWECAPWVTPAGCPEPRPSLGSACTQEGQECAYGPGCCSAVDVGPDMVCTDGVWRTRPIGCACPRRDCAP
jgi:hypothetical protein